MWEHGRVVGAAVVVVVGAAVVVVVGAAVHVAIEWEKLHVGAAVVVVGELWEQLW